METQNISVNALALSENNGKSLWCVPYDSESCYKDFLKIGFSRYLKELISNKYFPQYQRQMAKELENPFKWSDRCWHLIKLFEFLNSSFEISELDIIVTFIEEETLRKVMGHFRLWVDLERLYMFNFLNLDRMEFQQDRIFMTLYRTLMFLNTLFSEYDYEDFNEEFIEQFLQKFSYMLETLIEHLSKATKPLVEMIQELLYKFRAREANLINHENIEILRREIKVRIVQVVENIQDIEQRLLQNVKHQEILQEQSKLKTILEMSFIDGLNKQVETMTEPKKRIVAEYQHKMLEARQEEDPNEIQARIDEFQSRHKHEKPQASVYQILEQTKHNPYDEANFSVYGHLIKLNFDQKENLNKKEEKKVVSKNDDDELKIYYQKQYLDSIENIESNQSKITKNDLAKKNTLTRGGSSTLQKSSDDQNKVFNLTYSFIEQERLKQIRKDKNRTSQTAVNRDFDNNILFKNQIDEHLENAKVNMLRRFALNQCQSKTFLDCKIKSKTLFPENFKHSFGLNSLYDNKQPLWFDLEKLKSVNRNKFDEMRQIITYMTVQKKIRNLIFDKVDPDKSSRNFSDIKTTYFDPRYFEQKIKFAIGQSDQRPKKLL